MARADGLPRNACARAPRRGPAPARLARPAERAVRRHVRRSLPRTARPHGGEWLRRVRSLVPALNGGEARGRRTRDVALKVAVVGGGLAGLAAALDLVDAGADVRVHEARPTLGGAVQTLPERDDDPKPPPDNGQHIALGCFTEYLRFLDRVGEGKSYLRKRLALPVIDERSHVSSIAPLTLLRYAHIPVRDRLRLPLTLMRLRAAQSQPKETFGDILRRLGETEVAIDRFWGVFIRPALNLSPHEVDGYAGLFTAPTALLGPRANSDLVLPLKPLGWMHGDAP